MTKAPDTSSPVLRFTGAFLASGLTLAGSGTHAAEIPRFDVDGSCKRMAIANTGSQVSADVRDKMANSCIAAQQDAYDAIKGEWGDLSEQQQALCLRETVQTGNYRSMQYCVDAAYEVAQNRKRETPRSFRY